MGSHVRVIPGMACWPFLICRSFRLLVFPQPPFNVKTKPSASENKSSAAKKLGGQPENDQDARDAGVASATDTTKPKKTK